MEAIIQESKELESNINELINSFKEKHPAAQVLRLNLIEEGNEIGRTDYGQYEVFCAINAGKLSNELKVTCSSGEVTITQGNHILKMETSSFIDIINESQKDMVYRDEDTKELVAVGKYFV